MEEKPAPVPASASPSNGHQSDGSGKDESQHMNGDGDGADAERAQTQIEGERRDLPPEHREFLLARHGTLDLDPIPGPDAADPYNWPAWKVRR